MSNDNKYSNNVRVIEELQKISDAPDQKKQLIKSSQKAGATALGSVVLNTSVAKNVKADDTAVTPGAFVGTVTVGGDSSEPDDGDVQYGVGEMYITSDGEIYIYSYS